MFSQGLAYVELSTSDKLFWNFFFGCYNVVTMQLTKTHKIIIGIVFIIILFGLYMVFSKQIKQGVDDLTNKTATTTTTDLGNGVVVRGNGDYTIEQVPIEETTVPQPIPDLTRVSVAEEGARITAEAKTLATEKIKTLQTQLKTDPSSLPEWLDLGMYQKMAGDYAGAVISWTYAAKLSPTSYLPSGNLGDLYAYFFKDYSKSVMYYKEAISKGPTQVYLYVQLTEVYRDLVKDVAKAKAIVEQGLSKIPNDPNLLQLQESLK
jgi:tetratricopeptide (TPR) repeat protein